MDNNKLNFNWFPYEEDIFLTGKKGEGKTSRCCKILDLVPNCPRWIWSPRKPIENFGHYAQPVNKFSDLKRGAYLWTGTYNKANFLMFCKKAMLYDNLLFIVDDVHEYVTKQFMPEEFETLVLSGRNQGISGIYMSPLPALVPNQILGNVSHVFAFKMKLSTHVEWLAKNFFGKDAYILLKKDKRFKFFTGKNDIDDLPRHSFLYNYDGGQENQLVIDGLVQNQYLNSTNEEIEDSEPITEDRQSDSSSLSREGMQEEIQLKEKPEHPSQDETQE